MSIMCRELKTVGYRNIKAKMDNGEIPLGDLRCGSAWCALKVGPVVDLITGGLRLMTSMNVWNGRLGRQAGTWDITIVFRGYMSRDYGITDKYPAFPVTGFITLDKETLELHWDRASVRVEALKRID
jgi:hypothetical protein